MKSTEKQLFALWRKIGFEPDPNQKSAILHVNGPLYLPAGPGVGKTRVLLWRALNLILFHEVRPDQIFLATFTEKAALQLRDGLRGLLGTATLNSGSHFDISHMYVGTVHALCARLIADRRFSPNRIRLRSPALLDDLAQLLHIYKASRWNDLIAAAGLQSSVTNSVNKIFGSDSSNRFEAAANCISFFNRLSEECVDPAKARHKTRDEGCHMLLDLYEAYLRLLREHTNPPMTDFSLLQHDALSIVDQSQSSKSTFRHIIVDEYQDTNAVQERLFFKLAEGHKNLCVVGDDDQSLYRFRGATVQNFVDFPARCKRNLSQQPTTIPLGINYRSRSQIVEFCTDFITRCDWKKPGQRNAFYRVVNKDITAKSSDRGTSVLASNEGNPDEVCAEIASLVRDLIDQGKVTDPNQIAFLFPSLKSPYARRLMNALQDEGLKVYAPRAGRFLETDEALAIFGIYLQIFGKPVRAFGRRAYHAFHDWIDAAWTKGADLLKDDTGLRKYVAHLRAEIATAIFDYNLLAQVVSRSGWKLADSCESQMRAELLRVRGLSPNVWSSLNGKALDRLIELRQQEGRPISLGYVINRVTSLDWNVLDVFYRLCEFKKVKAYIDSAENGADEGPICNLALISQYVARYLEGYTSVLTAEALAQNNFQRVFFSSYLYVLFRRGDSEFENAEDPFPRGRIPFITIHQAKGLEFPVVVLGNPRKDTNRPQLLEELVAPLIDCDAEPRERMAEFDAMRMFYVALSRAKNLLIIPHYRGRGQRLSPPFDELVHSLSRITDLDVNSLPPADGKKEDIPKTYSYTADYLPYQRCPRQYMIFRKYGFAPARSQTMFFGSLVHQTIEDLHQHLIAKKMSF